MMNYFHTDFLFQKYWYDSADNENKYIFWDYHLKIDYRYDYFI